VLGGVAPSCGWGSDSAAGAGRDGGGATSEVAVTTTATGGEGLVPTRTTAGGNVEECGVYRWYIGGGRGGGGTGK
jgi:hypothetical protein